MDGNDVLAVYQAAGEAIERARAGGGPTLLECKTYRTRPHSEGMRDGGYRTREEIDSWRARDPITMLRDALVQEKIAETQEIDQIDNAVQDTDRRGGRVRARQPLAGRRLGDGAHLEF